MTSEVSGFQTENEAALVAARAVADRIRKDTGSIDAPIDTLRIAKLNRFTVEVSKLDEGFLGGIDFRQKVIYVSSDASPDEQAFAIAFLLGQDVLAHEHVVKDISEQFGDNELFAVTLDDLLGENTVLREFAREIIAPKALVAEYKAKAMSQKDLEQIFVAPPEFLLH